MIGQELDLERLLVELGAGQRLGALFECCAGDRQGVDRVGLAAAARRAPSARHQLRCDPDDTFAAGDHEALERAGDVAAVLDRPDPLAAELPGPGEQPGVPARLRAHRLAASQLTGERIHRSSGVGRLVWVRSNHDHLLRPFRFSCHWRFGPPADRPHWGRSHAPIKSRRRSSNGGGRHNECRSDLRVDSDARSQPATSPRTKRPCRTSPAVTSTLTVRRS